MADNPRLTMPTIPATDPRFKWTPHGDVQATWHRLTGWTPPSAKRTQFYEEPTPKLRRAK